MSRIRFGLRPAVLLGVCLAAISLQACVAAIAVMYFKTDENYIVEMDAKRSADEVWTEVVRVAEKAEAEGRMKILKKNDTERLLKGTDGVQTAQVKVSPLGAKSRVTIIATAPKGEEIDKEQELSARIAKRFCKEAVAKCKLEEE